MWELYRHKSVGLYMVRTERKLIKFVQHTTLSEMSAKKLQNPDVWSKDIKNPQDVEYWDNWVSLEYSTKSPQEMYPIVQMLFAMEE